MRFDVTALGELLIDLVPVSSADNLVFAAKPGGAPGNVAAGAARLGLAAAMLSKVGQEVFGEALINALTAAGVHVDAIARASDRNTALAVVSLTPEGDRDFFFYRDNCADANYAPEDLPLDLIRSSRILHVGTVWLATPVSAAAQRHALVAARESGVLISADPNFRPAFWRDPAAMREAGREVIRGAQILKISEEELAAVSGLGDIAAAVRSIWHSGMIAVAVTKGAAGAELFTAEHAISTPGFPVAPVDTVGCGDAFMASFLAGLIEAGLRRIEKPVLERIGIRACAAGALMATFAGAMESMPSQRAVDEFLGGGRSRAS